MYKSAMRNLMRITRTGNDATKPHPVGRVDMMPAWAEEPEEYYNTLREQFARLVAYIDEFKTRIVPLDELLKHPSMISIDECVIAQERRDDYGRLVNIFKQQLAELDPLVKAADMASRDAIKFHLAKRYLDFDALQRIEADADKLVRDWRPRAALGEFPEEFKVKPVELELDKVRAAKNLKRRQQRRVMVDNRNFAGMSKKQRAKARREEAGRAQSLEAAQAAKAEVRKTEAMQQEMARKLEKLRQHFS